MEKKRWSWGAETNCLMLSLEITGSPTLIPQAIYITPDYRLFYNNVQPTFDENTWSTNISPKKRQTRSLPWFKSYSPSTIEAFCNLKKRGCLEANLSILLHSEFWSASKILRCIRGLYWKLSWKGDEEERTLYAHIKTCNGSSGISCLFHKYIFHKNCSN